MPIIPYYHYGMISILQLSEQVRGSNRVSYKAVGDQLIITYDRVTSFAPVTDWVSYQVIVEFVTGQVEVQIQISDILMLTQPQVRQADLLYLTILPDIISRQVQLQHSEIMLLDTLLQVLQWLTALL